MPAYARKEIVDESVVGVYHCVSRCVRRAFLCGTDHYTGRNFDHRKAWMQGRLEELAGIFALDILGFSLMSNHFHVLLRNRPDVAATWSDEEVARRWYRLHPWRRNEDGTPAEPEPCELAAMQADPDRLAARRRRLASLSTFMASLCEPIARRAWASRTKRGAFFPRDHYSEAAGKTGRARNPGTSGGATIGPKGNRKRHDVGESAGPEPGKRPTVSAVVSGPGRGSRPHDGWRSVSIRRSTVRWR